MKRIALVATASIVLGLAAGVASAGNPHRVLATPAEVCKTLIAFEAGGYASFGDCMAQLRGDVAALRFPADPTNPASPLIALDEHCTRLEQGLFDPILGEIVQVTYPFFFDEPPGWPFPEFTAQNHNQCILAIYAYHRLAIG
jgi:hypothetical protein